MFWPCCVRRDVVDHVVSEPSPGDVRQIAKEGPQNRCGARASGSGVSRLRRSNELRPVLPVLTSFSKRWRKRSINVRREFVFWPAPTGPRDMSNPSSDGLSFRIHLVVGVEDCQSKDCNNLARLRGLMSDRSQMSFWDQSLSKT